MKGAMILQSAKAIEVRHCEVVLHGRLRAVAVRLLRPPSKRCVTGVAPRVRSFHLALHGVRSLHGATLCAPLPHCTGALRSPTARAVQPMVRVRSPLRVSPTPFHLPLVVCSPLHAVRRVAAIAVLHSAPPPVPCPPQSVKSHLACVPKGE